MMTDQIRIDEELSESDTVLWIPPVDEAREQRIKEFEERQRRIATEANSGGGAPKYIPGSSFLRD